MASNFSYPTSAELEEIEQDKLPNLIQNRPIFREIPIRTQDAALLLWEQQDNYGGLQQIRGMNGQPQSIKKVGAKRYRMDPGVYGEFELLDEMELTQRRQFGTWDRPVSIDDLVTFAQDKLLERRLDRIEKIGWDLFTTGTFSVYGPGPSGPVLMQTDTFTLQTFSSVVPWATAATATPLADFRTVKLKHRGHSVNFGTGARAYANTVTVNRLLANTNNADFYGRRTAGLGTINSLDAVNQLLGLDGLPTVVEYDEGYLDESLVFQPFIPDGVVVLIGKRTSGASVGEYRMTRNANNPGLAPGSYTRVIDRFEDDIPRRIEVHDGHNGGPVLFFPGAIVLMTVS